MKKFWTIVCSIIMFLCLTATSSPSAKAQGDNVVKFVLDMEWTTINPFLCRSTSDVPVLGLIYEPLVVVNLEGEAQPWLAKSWDVSSDGKVVIFHLNESARWADGQPVTAYDVKFTWDTSLKYGLVVSIEPEMIMSLDVLDDHTVSFTMIKPYAPYLVGIAQVMIVPKHVWETIPEPDKYPNLDPEKAFGSGPMRFKEWKVGEYVELMTNKNYWRKKILIDGVIINLYTSSEAGVLALEKGEVDAYDELVPEAVPSLLGSKEITVFVGEGVYNHYLSMNHRIYPNNIRKFRKAIDLAVDKKMILEQAHHGYGTLATGSYIPPRLKYWFNPQCNWPGLNMTDEERIAKANAMLDELEFYRGSDGVRVTPNGTRLEIPMIVFAGQTDYVREAEIIRDSCAQIGVKVNLIPMETESAVSLVYGGGAPLGWTWSNTGAPYGADPDFMTAEFGHDPPDPWWNADAHGYFNDTLTELLKVARRETNVEKRREIFFKAQEIFADDVPVIMLVYPARISAYRTDKFTGWKPESGVNYQPLIAYGCYTILSVINIGPIEVSPAPTPAPTPVWTEVYAIWAMIILIAVVIVVAGWYYIKRR